MSTRLDDLCNKGQRHMSEGDDRPSSEFDMSTRVDDMCNEEATDICNDGRRYVVFV
jgi:hypothetical protein